MRRFSLLLPLVLVACGTQTDASLDRSVILASAKGSRSRVVVVVPDGAADDVILASLRLWQDAGTDHVLHLDPSRLKSAPGLFRLADIIEITGAGPYASLQQPSIRAALAVARTRGAIILGDP
jgi:hypothetical protein